MSEGKVCVPHEKPHIEERDRLYAKCQALEAEREEWRKRSQRWKDECLILEDKRRTEQAERDRWKSIVEEIEREYPGEGETEMFLDWLNTRLIQALEGGGDET